VKGGELNIKISPKKRMKIGGVSSKDSKGIQYTFTGGSKVVLLSFHQ